MSDRPMYTASCERSGRWWAVHVPEVPGVFTQARRLDQVESIVRDALALFLGVPADSFDLRIEVELPDDWAVSVDRMQKLRHDAEMLQDQAGAAAAEAVEKLIGEGGLSVRDAGRVLGLSFQRIAQLRPQRSKAPLRTPRRSRTRRAAVSPRH